MNRALIVCLLLASCTPIESPYPWFEKDWVSDRDSTFAANEAFHDQSPDDLEAFLSMYGELRWRVDGFNLAAIYPSEPRFNLQSDFDIEAIDASSFRLLTESGASFTISGNENGFCATPNSPDETIECFVPFES